MTSSPAIRFDPHRPPSAEQLDQMLASEPGNIEALRRRAVIRLDAGDIAGASRDIDMALRRAGKRPDAELLCAATRIDLTRGRLAPALRNARLGLHQKPGHDELRGLLGAVLQKSGKTKEAIEAYEQAVNLNPFKRTYRMALAVALEEIGDLDRAERVYRHLLMVDKESGDATLNLANLLHKRENFQAALELYKRTLKIVGHQPHIYANLGALYRKLGDYERAHRAYRVSAVAKPGDSGLLYNLGNLYRAEERPDRAISTYRRAVACRPGHAEIHWNLALALLSNGDLADGFEEYEWRWQYENFPSRRRDFKQPLWDGSSFDGRTMLLHTEQGVGDVFQFLRFIPAIVERKGATGRIILECHDTLTTLLDGFPGIDGMIERFAPPPRFDIHLPLLSAPRALGIGKLEDLPNAVPYLPVPDVTSAPLEPKSGDALRVGFVFGGNPQFSGDRTRSTELSSWAPLFDVEGVRFFCLQKGDREPETADLPAHVVRANQNISTFLDTAVLMQQFDLVISTCTSVAHLAGALGRPVWVVLSHSADWRWLVGRDDSPWYPTARLFRQTRPGDWDGVFARVRAALQEEAAKRSGPGR